MNLASQFRIPLSSGVATLPRDWPFEDKVLVLLMPGFRDDVLNCHGGHGREMAKVFEAQHLEHFDVKPDRLLGVTIQPLLDFGVAAGKGKRARTVMI